jgi:hypothetical protein
MAASTGPIAAATGIVAGTAILVHDKPPISQARVIVGGAIAAAGLALLEHALPGVALALAWTVLVAVLFVRVDPATPAPLESINTWINGK